MRPTQNSNGDGGTSPRAAHTPRYRVSGAGSYGAPRRPSRPLRPSRTVTRSYSEPDELTQRISSLRERFNGWRLGISIEGDTIIKFFVIALLLVVLTILQTTFFTRFRPFGVVPDLMLPFVIAVATLEREKWGAVTALVAAYVIDAAGGTTVMLLPLLYVPAAFVVGILTTHRFRDSFPVAALYTVITTVIRSAITFAIALMTIHGISAPQVLSAIVLPELAANIVMAVFPQLVTRLCLKPFHKTRAERTGR